jgi:hypothetical protein
MHDDDSKTSVLVNIGWIKYAKRGILDDEAY